MTNTQVTMPARFGRGLLAIGLLAAATAALAGVVTQASAADSMPTYVLLKNHVAGTCLVAPPEEKTTPYDSPAPSLALADCNEKATSQQWVKGNGHLTSRSGFENPDWKLAGGGKEYFMRILLPGQEQCLAVEQGKTVPKTCDSDLSQLWEPVESSRPASGPASPPLSTPTPPRSFQDS